jgi:soluble lytic murein transglycosylase-like protein
MEKKLKWLVFGILVFIIIYIVGKNSDTSNPITDFVDDTTNMVKDAVVGMIKHTEYDDIIQNASDKYGVPFEWIKAVIYTESGFSQTAYRAEAKLNDGSIGLMQILYKTAQSIGFSGMQQDLYEPAVNIEFGTKYIRDCYNRSGAGVYDDGSFQIMYSAYNSGSGSKFMTSDQVDKNVVRAYNWLVKIEKGEA